MTPLHLPAPIRPSWRFKWMDKLPYCNRTSSVRSHIPLHQATHPLTSCCWMFKGNPLYKYSIECNFLRSQNGTIDSIAGKRFCFRLSASSVATTDTGYSYSLATHRHTLGFKEISNSC